jgi:signal peptidase I
VNRRQRALLVISTLIAGIVGLLVMTGTVKVFRIPTGGMSPTIQPGDHVTATRIFKPAGKIARGQLVVFNSARANPRLKGRFLQRVVATGGDTVDLIDGRLQVNGQPLPDRDGKIPRGADWRAARDWALPKYPLVIPQDHIFALGDNHDNSLDSRYFGSFPVDAVTHRPGRIILPLSRAGKIE